MVRAVLLAMLGGAVLMGCTSGQDSATSQREDAQPSPSSVDADLPTSELGDPNLPTVPGQPSDTIVVESTSSTTTTAAPTTTTTVPPPVIPSDVLFDTGSAELKPEATPYLTELAEDIEERHPGATLRFVGHTDSRGSEAVNLDLSRRRAEAVLEWFVVHGFQRSRLTALGAGESELQGPDFDEHGRFDDEAGARNRRVEIEIGT